MFFLIRDKSEDGMKRYASHFVIKKSDEIHNFFSGCVLSVGIVKLFFLPLLEHIYMVQFYKTLPLAEIQLLICFASLSDKKWFCRISNSRNCIFTVCEVPLPCQNRLNFKA